MYRKVVILVVLISNYCMSQHTHRFLKLTKDLVVLDSLVLDKSYTNGQVKELVTKIRYAIGEDSYSVLVGLNKTYLKDGTLLINRTYDNYGNMIHERLMDFDETLMKEVLVTKIDTQSNDAEDILKSKRKLIIDTYEKEYYRLKNGRNCLYKQGARRNGKKVGEWIKFNCRNGRVLKKKQYSQTH